MMLKAAACAAAVGLLVATVSIAPASAQYDGYPDDYPDDYYGYGPDGYDYSDYGDPFAGSAPAQPDPRVTGFVEVDDVTFDKVVSGPYSHFVLFYDDKASTWTDTLDVLKEFGMRAGHHLTLLLSKIDGEANASTASRFGITAQDMPAFLFFPEGSKTPVKYSGEVTADSLQAYVTAVAGEPYTVKALKPLLEEFLSETDARDMVISKIESATDELSPAETEIATWYVKIMKKILSKGDEYVSKEFTRLGSILTQQGHSLKQDKIDEFIFRRNVLKVFNPDLKDEL